MPLIIRSDGGRDDDIGGGGPLSYRCPKQAMRLERNMADLSWRRTEAGASTREAEKKDGAQFEAGTIREAGACSRLSKLPTGPIESNSYRRHLVVCGRWEVGWRGAQVGACCGQFVVGRYNDDVAPITLPTVMKAEVISMMNSRPIEL